MVYKLQMSFLLMKVLFLYNSWVEMFLFLSHTKITFNINLIKFYGFFPVIFLEAKNVCICCVREYSGVVFGFIFCLGLFPLFWSIRIKTGVWHVLGQESISGLHLQHRSKDLMPVAQIFLNHSSNLVLYFRLPQLLVCACECLCPCGCVHRSLSGLWCTYAF